MKKPYSSLKELNLKQFVFTNLSSNKHVELDKNRHLEYIQKYFPGFGISQKTNAKFHQIDDPVIQQHKLNHKTYSNNPNYNPAFNNQSVISINGITVALQQHQTNPVTLRPPSTIPSLPNILGCPADQPNGTWSRWIITTPCSADCGSCGRLTRTRQCLSFNIKTGSGCPCRGEYKQLEQCNIGVCQFPKPACCPPYNLIFIEGHFACGPHNETIIQNFLQQISTG